MKTFGGVEHYTCGFLFWRDSVLLVRKDRPEWQDGLLNGIGGKLEVDESATEAMVREFTEETGLAIAAAGWHYFACENAHTHRVYFYRAEVPPEDKRPEVPAANDVGEALFWVDRFDLDMGPVVGNLQWLLPLARDWRRLAAEITVITGDIRERPTW